MDPQTSAQDILQCQICESHFPPLSCEFCRINLCKICAGEHLLDDSRDHKVVPIKMRRSTINYPKCPTHTNKQCELHCEKCDNPICAHCISSNEHLGHKACDIMKVFNIKKEILQKDLQELDKLIYPKYQDMALNTKYQKAGLENHSQKLITTVEKWKDDLHKEIDSIINRKKAEISKSNNAQLTVLSESEDETAHSISDIRQHIVDLKNLQESSDVYLVSAYKSRIDGFRKLPPKLKVTFQSFCLPKINTTQLFEELDSLNLTISVTKKEQEYKMDSPGYMSSLSDSKPVDEFEIITSINTDYRYLFCVTCMSDEEIWVCGNINIMKLYNLQGEQLKSIKSKSENMPWDIAVTKSRDLIYTDFSNRSVNLIRKSEIQKISTLRGWGPIRVCITSSDDILIMMRSDDKRQVKIVRYSGSMEKQSIQFDDKGKPLYSPISYIKYICENKNQDVCVSDYFAGAVVVVNQKGKFRFKYTGSSNAKESFKPVGIATDNQERILTSDCKNNCICILDSNGEFLRFIENCDLNCPWGLCVDSRDNLYVVERNLGRVKKIKYNI